MDIFSLQQAMAARALMGTGGLPFHLAHSPTSVSKPSWVSTQSMGLTPRALETPSPASSSNIESKFEAKKIDEVDLIIRQKHL